MTSINLAELLRDLERDFAAASHAERQEAASRMRDMLAQGDRPVARRAATHRRETASEVDLFDNMPV